MALQEVNESQFENAIANGNVLVDFWASWCGPCKMLAPTLERIAQGRDDIKIVKCNIEENQKIATKYKIMNIPFMVLFKNGQIAGNLMGNLPQAKIEKFLDDHL